MLLQDFLSNNSIVGKAMRRVVKRSHARHGRMLAAQGSAE